MKCVRAWKSVGWLALGLAVLLHAGCGSGENRKAVFGTITGAEGRNGSLSLVPAGGNEGPSAVTQITNGAYQYDSSTGPSPGPHVAHILLEKTNTPAATDNPKVGGAANPLANSSPLDQLSIDVTVPDQAPFQVDINLSAAKPAAAGS